MVNEASRRDGSDQLKIAGGFLAAIMHDVEAHCLTIGKIADASAFQRADVDEDVLASAVRLNETITLLRVEPLNFTLRHIEAF